MSALTLPQRAAARLPVQTVDTFKSKVDELLNLALKLDRLELEIRDLTRNPYGIVSVEMPALPEHALATLATLTEMSQPASPEESSTR